MADTTVTLQEILWKLAAEVGELRGAYVTAGGGTGTTIATDLTDVSDDFYNHGMIRTLVSTHGVRTVSDYVGTSKTLTINSGFTTPGPAVGESVQLAWWNGNKYARAVEAVNQAIAAAWPAWYREQIILSATATLTMAAATARYNLPTDCDFLLRIGNEDAVTGEVEWLEALDLWRVRGQRGAYILEFYNNGRWYLPSEWDGDKLCLRYATMEPPLTTLTSTTRLPLDYFSLAASIYERRKLPKAGRSEQGRLNVSLPQLQQEAVSALVRLGFTKDSLDHGMEYGPVGAWG